MPSLGWALIGATPLLGIIYVLLFAAGVDRSLTGLAIAAVCAAPLGGLVNIVNYVHDRRCSDRAAELRETTLRVEAQVEVLREAASEIRQAIAELDELRSMKRAVIVAMEEQNRLYRAEIAALRGELASALAEALGRNIAILEQVSARIATAGEADRRLVRASPDGSSPNGEAVQPMALSDEALRGYFLGLYDREKPGADGN